MLDTIPKKYAEQLWLIRSQVRAQLPGQTEKYSKEHQNDLRRALKYDAENFKSFEEGRSNVLIGVFPQSQRLCSAFAHIKTPLHKGESHILLRPSFSFPFIKPPNMIPCVDSNVILDAFTTSKGQIPIALKPEAPWIKKDATTGSVKFTDDIYITEANMDGCDTPDSERDAKRRAMQDEDDQYAQPQEEPHSFSQPVFLKKNIFI